MNDFKDWPLFGKVLGALAFIGTLTAPMLATAFFLGRAAAVIKTQGENQTVQNADVSRRLESVEGKIDEQSIYMLKAGYESSSRFSDLERRVGTLEAARVLEPR